MCQMCEENDLIKAFLLSENVILLFIGGEHSTLSPANLTPLTDQVTFAAFTAKKKDFSIFCNL